MNARQWSAWRKKINQIETLIWTKKFHIGAKLLDLLVVHGGGYFELRYVQVRNKTERQVFLTDLCRQMIDDCASHLEYTPVLRPMIVPPNPWHWDKHQKTYVGGCTTMSISSVVAFISTPLISTIQSVR